MSTAMALFWNPCMSTTPPYCEAAYTTNHEKHSRCAHLGSTAADAHSAWPTATRAYTCNPRSRPCGPRRLKNFKGGGRGEDRQDASLLITSHAGSSPLVHHESCALCRCSYLLQQEPPHARLHPFRIAYMTREMEVAHPNLLDMEIHTQWWHVF